MSNTLWSAK